MRPAAQKENARAAILLIPFWKPARGGRRSRISRSVKLSGYEADGGRMDALIYTHYSIDAPPVYTSPDPAIDAAIRFSHPIA
jgi:hypothetical protein